MDPQFLFDDSHEIKKSSDEERNSSEGSKDTDEGSLDALMRDYDGYGTTPPRTRIHHKLMKKRISICKVVKGLRKRSPAFDHHSNVDSEEDGIESKKKSDKRMIHLLRSSERHLKLNEQGMSESKEEQYSNPSTYKVESIRRFMSLNCKLVKSAKNWKCSSTDSCKNRSDFHLHLENLVKAGTTETKNYKTQESHEQFWQTELKDLIWLELQAWRADRTATQQDKFLCEARQAVPQLLEDILNYRFEKKLDKRTTDSTDSGVDIPNQNEDLCTGCICLFCPSCKEHEVMALHEVGNLLSRLEAAEALFPSSKSFGTLFPCYLSHEFRSRVKAMCLWFNMTGQLRLKTLIIGKQLMFYAKGRDPITSFDSTLESPYSAYSTEWNYSDLSCIQPLQQFEKLFMKANSGEPNPYRKYIEDVLKTKGLKKSFQFMEQLHLQLLRKSRIALEKPDPENKNNYHTIEENQLQKYGYWSEDYRSLNLPSFRSSFFFMSRIPFVIIHEFLRMRLETKLEKPSGLSIRQLMKELKEGLKFAVINKERFLYHCEVALIEFDEEYKAEFTDVFKYFDQTVQEIIKLYLSYLKQWVSITQFGKLQRNVLEEEWKFITFTAPHFPDCEAMCVSVFCDISCSVLKIICTHLKERVNALINEYSSQTEDYNLTPSATIFTSSNLTHRKMLQLCRGLQTLFIETRERTIHIVTLMKTLVKYGECDKADKMQNPEKPAFPLDDLREEALKLCEVMKEEINLVEDLIPGNTFDDNENFALQTRVREVIHQMYRYTFEYYKEIGKIVHFKPNFIQDMFQMAISWLNFVKEFCEQGRGVRPRWANFGIEFILFISSPKFTKQLSDAEFTEFRATIECGVDYIKGYAQPSPTVPNTASSSAIYRYNFSTPETNHVSSEDKLDGNVISAHCIGEQSREERLLSAIGALDEKLETKLRDEELIGTVLTCPNNNNYDKKFIKPRSVTFVWQRGIKIGQGRFGKVYTAVNCDSGELMAMKEISLSPNDARTIKNVATELKIFEGINHENLVKYYGAEIHREELLIFMELCPEGTLEGLIMASENGLPESIVRRYTKQLINAVSTLHEHSIVHRDIKPANIFLTSEGNKLKLGDFGSAVKIKAHTTAPGELKGFVGTQAYMAPEVFMKTNTVGHGRAADIWSVGCVVIEMSSGKRPWAEYDSNYQIMFKVGMGETPEIPSSLSEEGQNFVKKCIQHNAKRRSTTKILLADNFLKVESEEEGILCTMPSELEEYLKLGIKR